MQASEIDIAKNQLAQLNQYHAEYLKQFKDRKASGLMTEGESEDYQYFFASLDNSINEQQMVVGKLAEQHFNDNDNEAMYFGGRG